MLMFVDGIFELFYSLPSSKANRLKLFSLELQISLVTLHQLIDGLLQLVSRFH